MKNNKKTDAVFPEKVSRNSKPTIDAFARPTVACGESFQVDSFGEVRSFLARLAAWDGLIPTIPDRAFCDDLDLAIFRAAMQFRSRKFPTLREAVMWFTKRHKSIGVEPALEKAGKQLRQAFSSAPLIARLVEASRSSIGDSDETKLLKVLLSLNVKSKLSPFRQLLNPAKGESLHSAAWRARAEFSEWLLSFGGRDVWSVGITRGSVLLAMQDSWLWLLLRKAGIFGLPYVERGSHYMRGLQRERSARFRTRQKK